MYGPDPIKLDTFDGFDSITGVITDAVSKDFDNGPRLVVTLDDDLSLVLNNPNYRVIKRAYGGDTDDWIGKRLICFKGTIKYRDEEKESVCVRIPPDEQH